MNHKRKVLFLSTIFAVNFLFAQKQNSDIDTTNLDSFSKELIKKAQNWKQEDELWTKLIVRLSNPKIEIIYLQQPSHPFLAEYNRKIIFKSEKEQSDTISMYPNTGGRTLFNLFFQESEDKKIIVLEDNFGFYYYDIARNNYHEDIGTKKMLIMPHSHNIYLGRIDGESYPSKFIDARTKRETKIKHPEIFDN